MAQIFFGGIFGCIALRYFADKIGRKRGKVISGKKVTRDAYARILAL